MNYRNVFLLLAACTTSACSKTFATQGQSVVYNIFHNSFFKLGLQFAKCTLEVNFKEIAEWIWSNKWNAIGAVFAYTCWCNTTKAIEKSAKVIKEGKKLKNLYDAQIKFGLFVLTGGLLAAKSRGWFDWSSLTDNTQPA